jgi:hypothetical protein
MTTLLLERSPASEVGFERCARRRPDSALAGMTDAHGRLTLDQLITSVWEGLAVRGTVDCPVCASPMASCSSAADDGPSIGACLGCGSQLS